MDKPLTTTGGMDETGMDELCSALAALNRHGLRITGRLDAMATLDRHGLRISGHFHAMDIIQVGLCIANLESRLAEIERERDEAKRLAYLGDHHFPDLTWKARCEEAVADLRAAQSRLARIESLARAYLAAVDAESGQAIALAELRRALEGGE